MRKRTTSSRWQGMFDALGLGGREPSNNPQKPKRRPLRLEPLEVRRLLSAASVAALASSVASASTLQWIGNSGTWNATDSDWQIMDDNGNPVGSPRTWVDGADAVFPSSEFGTIQIASPITVHSLTFQGNSWNLQGSSITLSQAATTINVGCDSTTIESSLTGTGGLTKTGIGTLILSGTNTYSGSTTILAGRLIVGSGGLPDSAAISVVSGAAFRAQSRQQFRGRLSDVEHLGRERRHDRRGDRNLHASIQRHGDYAGRRLVGL